MHADTCACTQNHATESAYTAHLRMNRKSLFFLGGGVTFSSLKRVSVEVFRQDMLCFTGILHACPQHVNICCSRAAVMYIQDALSRCCHSGPQCRVCTLMHKEPPSTRSPTFHLFISLTLSLSLTHAHRDTHTYSFTQTGGRTINSVPMMLCVVSPCGFVCVCV